MKRRTFVKNTAAAAAVTAVAPNLLFGKSPFKIIPNKTLSDMADDNIVIIVEMFGGNDGLNTIIPVFNPTYYMLRPTLAYPQNMTVEVVKDKIYMNPSIVTGVHKDGFKHLFDTGRMAIVEGVGYKNPNLSHFRSEDIHLSGINSSDPHVKLLEGWMGRYFLRKIPNYPLEIPEHPLAVQIDGSVSLLFKTNKGHMSIALTDPDKFYELGAGLTPTDPLMSGGSYFGDEFNFVHTIAKQSDMYARAVKEAYDKGKDKIQVNYSDGFAQKFKMISALIAGGLQSKVFFVKLSNFDSHAQQMNADFTGQLPTLLRHVANGISEFLDDAQKQGFAERIVGFTISEYGRRTYDNGSRGTDHGAASMQFVFGGSSDYVNGGYFGNFPDLDQLDENGNVIYQHEFRRTFVDFLVNWLGATDEDIQAVFGEPFLPIGVIKPRVCNVEDLVKPQGKNSLLVFPNPSRGRASVTFELKKRANVDLSIYDVPGYLVQRLHQGWLEPGVHTIPFQITFAGSGNYVCALTCNCLRYSTNIVVVK